LSPGPPAPGARSAPRARGRPRRGRCRGGALPSRAPPAPAPPGRGGARRPAPRRPRRRRARRPHARRPGPAPAGAATHTAGPRLRPCAVRDRHQREAGLPGGRRQAGRGRGLGAAGHPRQRVRRHLSQGRARRPAADHRPGLDHRQCRNPRRGGRPVRLGYSRNAVTAMRDYDLIVIGAGIIGASCAERALADGRRVAIVEADVAGGGVTAASMGHLVAMDDDPAELALSQYSIRLWDAFEGLEQAEYRRCGTLWVAADGDEMAAVPAKVARLAAAGIRAEALDAAQLREIEPQLAPGLAGGMLVPGEG